MARVAEGDRPEIRWDAVGEVIDRPAGEARTAGKTVDDIDPRIRAHVEYSLTHKVVRVISINSLDDTSEAMAKEIARLAKLYGTLRQPALSVGATVVKDYHVPGQATPFPLAVTIFAQPKITRARKPKENGTAKNATANGTANSANDTVQDTPHTSTDTGGTPTTVPSPKTSRGAGTRTTSSRTGTAA